MRRESLPNQKERAAKVSEPYPSEGFVSLLRSSKRLPVKILCNTGSIDSFICNSVLPFSSVTDTEDIVLRVREMGMLVFPVPARRFTLSSGLVNGAVEMGRCTKFLLDGVDIILGNGRTGMEGSGRKSVD